MIDYFFGFFSGALVGMLLIISLLYITDGSPRKIKQQAFDRGYMVECIGKTGYYWECEE